MAKTALFLIAQVHIAGKLLDYLGEKAYLLAEFFKRLVAYPDY